VSRINRHLLVRVFEHLAERPDDSANEVWRAIGGRRGDVLRAVRSVRRAETTQEPPVPPAGSPTQYPKRGPGS
jgi:hypothetical protein